MALGFLTSRPACATNLLQLFIICRYRDVNCEDSSIFLGILPNCCRLDLSARICAIKSSMSGLADQAVSSSSTNSSVPLRLSSRATDSLSSISCSVSWVCWSVMTGVDSDTREDSDSVASLSCIGALVQALVDAFDMTSKMTTTNNLVIVEILVCD